MLNILLCGSFHNTCKMCAKKQLTLLLLTTTVFLFKVVSGDDTFKKCCELGSNWANEGLSCDQFPTPIAGIPEEKEILCLQSIQFCCKRAHREKQCNDGKDAAKANKECTPPNNKGDNYFNDCCEACKIGLSIKVAGGTCSAEDGSSPALISCCENPTTTTETTSTTSTSTTTTPTTSATTASTVTEPTTEATTTAVTENKTDESITEDRNKMTPPPLPELESLCEEHGHELCAHLCISTPGSYRCECRKGFVLMSDGKSCQQKDVSDRRVSRCKINNPCQHVCFDTGVAVRCYCDSGYKLNPDKRSCRDIDECKENIAKCDSPFICINEPGTYHCADPDSEETFDNPRTCPTGYTYNYDTDVCDDYDECFWVAHDCGEKSCENTIGSYTCVDKNKAPMECPNGFYYKSAIESCADIDECASGSDDCNKNSQICLNTYGSFTCQERASKTTCVAGFKLNSEGICEDIDECKEEIEKCNKNEVCKNEEGGYRCRIEGHMDNSMKPKTTTPVFYTTTERIQTTTVPTTTPRTTTVPTTVQTMRVTTPSTLETTTLRNVPRQTPPNYYPPPYQPTENRYKPNADKPSVTNCQPGHRFIPSRNECVDINECDEDQQLCDSTQDCHNTIGSYVCECRTGFILDNFIGACVDINECQQNMHDCQLYQRCDNTVGSYQCVRILSCGTGYTLNAASGLCEDDDECSLGSHDCYILGPNFQCKNTQGSFRCERKRCTNNCDKIIYTIPTIIFKPSTTSGRKPITSVHVQTCLPGFLPDHFGGCTDIDECRSSPCERHQKCSNTVGSYRCVNMIHCPPGYKIAENGTICEDIDECELGTHSCTGNQKCINRNGYHICQCPLGTTKNLLNNCEDINECKKQMCPSYAQCINTFGSYKCRCKDGLRDTSDGKSCDDINECLEHQGLCHQICVNTWGDYRCACNPGYLLNVDNRTCTDIDECEEFKDRNLCVGICQNTPGSYVCRCPEGFNLASDGRTCIDIDECERGNICPNPTDMCWNIRGGHRCNTIRCPANYIVDPEHKKRCRRIPGSCHYNDNKCLRQMPNSYSYHFINFPSKLPLPHTGYIQLFKYRGPYSRGAIATFDMKILDVRCPTSIARANNNFFKLQRNNYSEAILLLSRVIEGPQEIDIEITMEMQHNGEFKGSVSAHILIVVSQYEF